MNILKVLGANAETAASTAITIGNYEYAEASAVASVTINKPAGVAKGDLLLAFLHADNSDAWTEATGSGWLEAVDSSGRCLQYKIVGNDEPTTYTFTRASSTNTCSGTIVAVRNARIDVTSTVSSLANPTVISSITLSQSSSTIFAFASVGSASASWTTPSGFTSLYQNSDATAPSVALFYKQNVASGATGTLSITGTSSSIGFQVALYNYTTALANDDLFHFTFNLEINLNTNNARGLCISNTGSNMYYTTSQASNYLRSLVMSTAYDLSTATLSNSDNAPSEPQGISMNLTGTQFHISRDGSDGVQYGTATTAYNISTVGTLSTFSTASQTTTPFGHGLGDSGTKMYVFSQGDATIYQYTLSTAYDVSTASYASKSFTDSRLANVRGVKFNLSGTKMYLTVAGAKAVFQYGLSTAWDITTASLQYIVSFNSTAYGNRDLVFNSDMTKMYLMSSNGGSASALAEYTRNL